MSRTAVRGTAMATVAACAAMAAGCASPVKVVPLATGQPATQAFELRGSDPNRLRAEAARLCDGTGDVLRDSHQGAEPDQPNGRLARWMRQAGDFFSTADREAELVVRCSARPDRDRLTAWLPPPSAAASPATGPEMAGATVSKSKTAQAATASSAGRGRGPSVSRSKNTKAIDADVPYGY